MASRKWLLAAAAGAAILAGCADYPYYGYNDPYYSNYAYSGYPVYSDPYPSYYGWYGPGYYVAPSVSFGLSYSNRGGYYRHHG